MGPVAERHALVLEQRALRLRAAEREPLADAPVGEDHPMAGDLARVGVGVQGEPHVPRAARLPDERGDLPVGGHGPLGDLAHRVVYPLEEALAVALPHHGVPSRSV